MTVELDVVAGIARQLRVDSIRCSTSAGSGHPTSSMSAADLLAVLVARHLHYDWAEPHLATNDHLIFSKGHASPLLYSVYRAVGAVDETELIDTYRRFGARLQGHPTPVLPWVDLATGSLGLGIAAAVGVALAAKHLDQLDYRTWVLCGDSETAEGSVWEALDKAAHYGLGNLTVMIDINRLGQRGPTELEWDLDVYAARVEAFGCRAVKIDGHDLAAIDVALEGAATSEQPTVILAKTIKGKGVSFLEDKEGWHGIALSPEDADKAIAELGGTSHLTVTGPPPPPLPPGWSRHDGGATVTLPQYELGAKVATRKAFGDALAALATRPDVVVLDAEVGNSTHADSFQRVAPERYFEAFIAEQLMVAAAGGFAARGYVPFASTFGAFFARAADFVRMLGISGLKVNLVGTHAGVEIGADGPSQMALEDLAIMRSIIGSTVLYPCDATSAAALVKAMIDAPGVAYLRATRGAYPVIYSDDHSFSIGGSVVVRESEHDDVSLIGAGVTLHSCLDAATKLADEGITARVIDCYSIKPLDTDTIGTAATETGALVIVEDHYAEGGIGEAVASALAEGGYSPKYSHLAVRHLSSSGTPDELMRAAEDLVRGHRGRRPAAGQILSTGTGPAAGPAVGPAAGHTTASHPDARSRKSAAVVATVLTVVIVGAVAFAVSSAIRRAPSIVVPPASTTLSIGSKVPVDFTLSRLGAPGSASLTEALDGHPGVVNFFASWCAICQKEMSTLGKNARSFGPAVRFIGIDTDDSAPGTAIAISKRAGIDYPLYSDPGGETIAEAYGATHLPTTFIVDGSGHLVSAILGQVTTSQLTAALDPLVARRGH